MLLLAKVLSGLCKLEDSGSSQSNAICQLFIIYHGCVYHVAAMNGSSTTGSKATSTSNGTASGASSKTNSSYGGGSTATPGTSAAGL